MGTRCPGCWGWGSSLRGAGDTGIFLTYISQTPHGDGEAFGARQQVVLEAGQPLGLGHLHADLVLLLREPSALTVNQELEGTAQRSRTALGPPAAALGHALSIIHPSHTRSHRSPYGQSRAGPRSYGRPRPQGGAWRLGLLLQELWGQKLTMKIVQE